MNNLFIFFFFQDFNSKFCHRERNGGENYFLSTLEGRVDWLLIIIFLFSLTTFTYIES